jgi:hypothetical protein
MSYRIKRVPPEHLQDALNGALMIGGVPIEGVPVGGRTVIFSAPAMTVTFPGSLGDMVRPGAIVTALRAAVSVDMRCNGLFYFVLWHDEGFTIGSGGTANSHLKLSTVGNTVSAGPVTADGLIAVMSDLIVVDLTPEPPPPEGDSVVDGSGNQVVDGSGNRVVP